jgi:hypothetical protein
MISLGPTQSASDVVAACSRLAELDFTATYVFAREQPEPAKIIDGLGAAVPRLA